MWHRQSLPYWGQRKRKTDFSQEAAISFLGAWDIRLTVEETNLLSIYNEDGKRGLTENINAALPFMDEDMRELAKRTLAKIAPLTENEYAELAIFAADEV